MVGEGQGRYSSAKRSRWPSPFRKREPRVMPFRPGGRKTLARAIGKSAGVGNRAACRRLAGDRLSRGPRRSRAEGGPQASISLKRYARRSPRLANRPRQNRRSHSAQRARAKDRPPGASRGTCEPIGRATKVLSNAGSRICSSLCPTRPVGGGGLRFRLFDLSQCAARNRNIHLAQYGPRDCHVATRRARSVGASGIVKPLRRRSATWSSRQREARGAFGRR